VTCLQPALITAFKRLVKFPAQAGAKISKNRSFKDKRLYRRKGVAVTLWSHYRDASPDHRAITETGLQGNYKCNV